MYYVYILECADCTLYTGLTVNLIRRVKEHNSSNIGAKYTKSRRPVKLVYSKKYRNRSLASKEESRVKALSRKEKMGMINQPIKAVKHSKNKPGGKILYNEK